MRTVTDKALVLSLFLCLAAAPAALGGQVHSYWASWTGIFPDVACDWSLHDESALAPAFTGGLLRVGTTAYAQRIWYNTAPPAIVFPDTLVLEFGMRHLSGGTQHVARGISQVAWRNGTRGNDLHIQDGLIFLQSANLTRGPSASVPTSDDVHDYVVEVAWSSGVVRVFRDGDLVITGSNFAISSTEGISWGVASTLSYGQSDWEYFRHNAAVQPCDVPTAAEPTTWGGLKLRAGSR